MPLGMIFWLLMILWLVFGIVPLGVPALNQRWFLIGGNFLLFVLLGLLGWATFGSAVK